MNVLKAAMRELQVSAVRAHEIGEEMNGRMLEKLYGVVDFTARLAGERNAGYRSAASAGLVSAALRAQAQAIASLVDDPGADEAKKVFDELEAGTEALSKVNFEVAGVMAEIAQGRPLPRVAVERVDLVVSFLTRWVTLAFEAGARATTAAPGPWDRRLSIAPEPGEDGGDEEGAGG